MTKVDAPGDDANALPQTFLEASATKISEKSKEGVLRKSRRRRKGREERLLSSYTLRHGGVAVAFLSVEFREMASVRSF